MRHAHGRQTVRRSYGSGLVVHKVYIARAEPMRAFALSVTSLRRSANMPQSLAEEFSMDISIPFEVLVVRIFGAVILCGLIGLEREFHRNTAGLRTNMLIGLAAVTFCIITIHMMETMAEGQEAARLDPIRLVEAVTAGIAFLAAGVVVYTRGDVKGLTTGASMWLSAAIGLSAGLGLWPLAFLASAVGIIVLWMLRRVQVIAGIKEE
ncbi:Membrane protein YhiD [Agrobacterium tumefaciens]|nr:Membrane protein YhiD [Agrobacterium tumefaciens]